MAARRKASAKNEITYVALMWRPFTRHPISDPSVQITIMGHRLFPHWMLSVATDSAARNSITQIPKFDGFQMCLPFTRSTYFDVMLIAAHSAYGQNPGERIRMPTLMPLMYALARLGNLPVKI